MPYSELPGPKEKNFCKLSNHKITDDFSFYIFLYFSIICINRVTLIPIKILNRVYIGRIITGIQQSTRKPLASQVQHK